MAYHILCIDDDPDFLFAVRETLKTDYTVATATSWPEGFGKMQVQNFDLVFLDIDLGPDNGLLILKEIKKFRPDLDVVMLTGRCEAKYIVEAIRDGASDYLCKPFEPEECDAIIEKLAQFKNMQERHDALMADMNAERNSRFLGASRAFRQVLESADRLKGHTANILVTGDSGTGKELLARHIHAIEENPKRPFIAVNCAAIPDGLIESELFGHEKGSFTGAVQRKIGKFELASGGDIFLDEINSLKPELQSKILRVLQEREICRVGGTVPIQVDFRVISATNENLRTKIDQHEFRQDLYHRLRVIELRMPPLRERVEDIPLLVAYFLDKFDKVKGQKRITAEALRALQNYAWPGNIRELENVVHSLIILSADEVIEVGDLPEWLTTGPENLASETALPNPFAGVATADANTVPLKKFIQGAARLYIQKILTLHNGDKSKTADQLHIGRTTLYGKMKELGIDS